MRYIISGIGKGSGGVGDYMQFIDENFKNENFKIITPIRLKIKNKYLAKLSDIISVNFFFRIKLLFLPKNDLTIVAQQFLGYSIMKNLLKRFNNIHLYIMDNSFFCLKSYNHIKNQNKACYKCLGGNFNNALINNCSSLPIQIPRKKFIKLNNLLLDYSSSIKFYFLSNQNALLAKKHFGNQINYEIMHHITDELNPNLIVREKDINLKFDFVLHAVNIDAKGFSYTIDLASKMSEYSFFIPTNKKISLSNVTTSNVRWESGFKKIVTNSKIILTPSFWSYTPETSSLKSFLYNGCVAMIENDYNYSKDIPENCFISLSGDIDNDVNILKTYIENENLLRNLKKEAKLFSDNYFKSSKNKLYKYFSEC